MNTSRETCIVVVFFVVFCELNICLYKDLVYLLYLHMNHEYWFKIVQYVVIKNYILSINLW